MPKQKRDKITSDLDAIMFSLWSSGLSFNDIADRLVKQGFNVSFAQVNKHAFRAKWAERLKIIDETFREYGNDRMRSAKAKKLQAIGLAVDAILDNVVKDYIDYKKDPDNLMHQIKIKKRPRPLFLTNDPRDLDMLIKMEQFVIDDGKQKIEGKIAHINVLSEDDRSNLLKLMAEAKQKTIQNTIESQPLLADIIIEDEDR